MNLGDYPKKLSPNSPENNGSLFTNPPVLDDVGSVETDPNFCRIDNNVFHIGFPMESHNGVTSVYVTSPPDTKLFIPSESSLTFPSFPELSLKIK